MSLLDLKCQDSICCSKNYSDIYKKRKSLLLGKDNFYDYMIYLYFNFPTYSCFKYLKEARLILCKIPVNSEEFKEASCKNENSEYSVYPLLDFFSIYSSIFSNARLDYNLKVNFEDKGFYSYTEVDITSIIKAWTKEEIENKGLILMGNHDAEPILYASNRYNTIGMQPKLRLIYDENHICPPLVTVPCNVEVN